MRARVDACVRLFGHIARFILGRASKRRALHSGQELLGLRGKPAPKPRKRKAASHSRKRGRARKKVRSCDPEKLEMPPEMAETAKLLGVNPPGAQKMEPLMQTARNDEKVCPACGSTGHGF